MKANKIEPILLDEQTHPGNEEFYKIPLMGEVHLENNQGSGGNYSLGELIKNFRQSDTQSVTLRALDNGLSGDGIFYGDFLTVELNSKPRNGDIAAVKLGSKIIIRRTLFSGGFIRLEATDINSSPIIVDPKTPGFEILGKIHTVIREL